MARVSQRGGKLLLSGILIEQAAAVIARYCSLGFALASHDRIEGWSTLELTKTR
ncbi:MAG: 50S ribosomal protein L11 methyltransferase [Pseudomonadota bacterium]